MLVQAFIAKLAVKALDIAVLHWPPRLDQDMANSPSLSPDHECPAGELRPVIGTHRTGISPKNRSTIQKPGYVLAGDAVIDPDLDALVAVVIGHRQAFDAPARGQAVADKVHAPDFIGRVSEV